MHVSVCMSFVSICGYMIMTAGPQIGQKMVSVPLTLQLKMVVRLFTWMLGIELRFSGRAVCPFKPLSHLSSLPTHFLTILL